MKYHILAGTLLLFTAFSCKQDSKDSANTTPQQVELNDSIDRSQLAAGSKIIEPETGGVAGTVLPVWEEKVKDDGRAAPAMSTTAWDGSNGKKLTDCPKWATDLLTQSANARVMRFAYKNQFVYFFTKDWNNLKEPVIIYNVHKEEICRFNGDAANPVNTCGVKPLPEQGTPISAVGPPTK